MKRIFGFLVIGILLLATIPIAYGLDFPDLSGHEITVYYMAGTTYEPAARKAASEFEELTGCKVRVVADPYATLFEKQLTSLITRSQAYDVLQVAYQWDGLFMPYLEPLNNFIDSYGIDMNLFIPGVLKNCGGGFDKIYGIPNACDVYSFIYRTDIFEGAGLKPPTNWYEVNEIAAKLTTDEIYGSVLAGLGEQVGQFWRARYLTLGGKFLNEEWQPQLTNNREHGLEAAQLLKDLLAYCPEGTLSYGYPEQMQAFILGRAAMAEVWPSFLRAPAGDEKESSIVGKWAFAPYPGGSGELSAWSLGIPNTSKNKDAAFAWIAFFTQESKQRDFFLELGIGPTLSSVYEDKDFLATRPDLEGILPGLMNPVPRFNVAQSQEAYDFMDARVSAFLADMISAEQMITEIQEKWEGLFSVDTPEFPYTGF